MHANVTKKRESRYLMCVLITATQIYYIVIYDNGTLQSGQDGTCCNLVGFAYVYTH